MRRAIAAVVALASFVGFASAATSLSRQVLSVSGASLTTAYTVSSAFQFSRASRVRFYVHCVRASGSSATTTTVKLQFRYNDGTHATGYVDLPSTKDDVSGTVEIEHAFSTSANATTDASFYLANPASVSDLTVSAKAGATGAAGDSTVVYAVAQ